MNGSIVAEKSHLFSAVPSTPNCASIYERRRHLLIGISPFNSRFSDDYIDRLVGWAASEFSEIAVLLAGVEAANLLEAIGTPRIKAERKVRHAVSRNRNSAERALRSHRRDTSQIFTFSDFSENLVYRSLRAEVEDAFRNQSDFRAACLEMSRAALLGRTRGINQPNYVPTENALAIAVEYVIAELPFFLAAPEIIGVEESLLAYHRPWALGEKVFKGAFGLQVHRNHGYLIVSEVDNSCTQANTPK